MQPAPVTALELRNVSKDYFGEQPLVILKNASLSIGMGERLAIVGPSGSGKSTLLNLMGTLDQPDSGSVWLNGHNLTELSAREAAKVRSREIGFIFQNHHLLPHCTALENVLIPLMASGQAATADGEHRARQLLNRVGLGERLNHLPGRLSGGERQRCAVVRSLINTPKVILADEPTGALDRANATEVGRLLTE